MNINNLRISLINILFIKMILHTHILYIYYEIIKNQQNKEIILIRYKSLMIYILL